MTSEIGREFELPNTPIAVTKLAGRLARPKAFDTARETRYETRVWTTKITGMTARSTSVSAVSWDASFVKTVKELAVFSCHATMVVRTQTRRE